MKATEIKLGQDYAYGTKGRWKTYQRVNIREIGRHRVLDDSDAEVPAARVQFEDGSDQWVVLRSILVPWAEHEAAQKRANRAYKNHAQRGSENAERARNAIKALAEHDLDTGTEPFEITGDTMASGFVRVKIDFLEDVVAALV
jgi:hypothetical protein